MAEVMPCPVNPERVHKYEPRYDFVRDRATLASATFFERPAPPPDKIYVGDVCSHCGHFIPRPKR